MKRIVIVGMIGAWSAFGLFVAACGGDDNVNKDGGGGMDATIDDTGTGMDTSMGMDGNMDMDGMMMGNDGSMGTDGGGGTGPNPGKVNCGTMLDCDAGGNGCCVHFQQDGGQTYACLPQGQCGGGGVRWECDERADCPMQDLCCLSSFQGFIQKQCNQFCQNFQVRACKSTSDCVDGGACNTYTCPSLGMGMVQIQACTKPMNCN